MTTKVTDISTSDFDGIYFNTTEDGENFEYSFFKLGEKYSNDPVPPTEIGHRWHIALFRETKEGLIKFDDHFEAVFENPIHYVRNMLDMGIEGCVLRKTANSNEWFNYYLDTMKKQIIIETLKPLLEQIRKIKF